MTSPHNAAAPLPADQTVRLDQTQVAEIESGAVKPDAIEQVRHFKLGSKSWPLMPSVPFVRAANIQKALTDFDLLALAEELPSIVTEDHRDEVRALLLADTEPDHPDHVTMMDVVDAWTAAQEVLSARPTRR